MIVERLRRVTVFADGVTVREVVRVDEALDEVVAEDVDDLAPWRHYLRKTCPGCGWNPIEDDGRCSKCGAHKSKPPNPIVDRVTAAVATVEEPVVKVAPKKSAAMRTKPKPPPKPSNQGSLF